MKKCENCGLSFDDNMNFCPKCGTKLSEEKAKCPSCGAPVENDDKFCMKCGASLSSEVKEEAKEEAKVEEIKAEDKPKDNKAVKIINIIACSVSLLALFFFFIGMFGSIFTATGTGSTEQVNMDMKYFFETYPKSLEQLKALPRTAYYSFASSMYIVELILYVGGMIACLVLSIIGTIRTIIALAKKKEPELKLVFSAGASMLPIILFAVARYSATIKEPGVTISTELGWGAGLIVAGLFLALSCVIAKNIVTAASTKTNVVPTILRSAAALVMLILLFSAFGPLSTMTYNTGMYSYDISMNGFYYGELAISQYSASTSATLNGGAFNAAIFSLIFTIISMVMLFNGYGKVTQDSKAAPIVFTALSTFFLILAAACSLVANQNYVGQNEYITYKFASSPIAGIVLSLVLVLPAIIVANVLSKKKEA